ncbi:hypothetical protein AAMO2058_000271800 [Amorphochlora amoebiformis]
MEPDGPDRRVTLPSHISYMDARIARAVQALSPEENEKGKGERKKREVSRKKEWRELLREIKGGGLQRVVNKANVTYLLAKEIELGGGDGVREVLDDALCRPDLELITWALRAISHPQIFPIYSNPSSPGGTPPQNLPAPLETALLFTKIELARNNTGTLAKEALARARGIITCISKKNTSSTKPHPQTQNQQPDRKKEPNSPKKSFAPKALPLHLAWAQPWFRWALTSTGAQRENQPCFGEDERGEGWERGWGEGCMRLLGGLDEGETITEKIEYLKSLPKDSYALLASMILEGLDALCILSNVLPSHNGLQTHMIRVSTQL